MVNAYSYKTYEYIWNWLNGEGTVLVKVMRGHVIGKTLQGGQKNGYPVLFLR